MFYTVLWLILFLLMEKTSLAIGTMPFWALVVAILSDLFFIGVWPRRATWFK